MPFYVVIASNIDDTQRDLVQECVKGMTETWWHQWEDAWVLETDDNLRTVADKVLPFFKMPGSEALVLPIQSAPGKARATFAGRLAKRSLDWFEQNFRGGSSDVLAELLAKSGKTTTGAVAARKVLGQTIAESLIQEKGERGAKS